MFSSNQIFDVSCERGDLDKVISAAMALYGTDIFTRKERPVRLAFSEPVPGLYAIGAGSLPGPNGIAPGRGWTDYPFGYDPKILAPIVRQWINSRSCRKAAPQTDGSCEKGVRVLSLHSFHECDEYDEYEDLSDELWDMTVRGRWDALQCIVLFTPTWLTYDK